MYMGSWSRTFLAMSVVLALLAVAACARADTIGKPDVTSAAPKATAAPSSGGWQEKWDKTLSDAKKEGGVLVYGNVIPATREALIKGFTEKFGIPLDVLILIGPEGASKLNAEYRAGIHQVDVLIGGPSIPLTMLKPEGNVASMEPLIILPEVKDPKAWADGQIPFMDKEAMALGFIRGYQPGVVRNTELVKAGEITSYKDLLKPQWKGKIIMFDPTIVGSGSAGLTSLTSFWKYDGAMDYLRSLAGQDIVVTRDYRLQVEQVSRGKYALALWARAENTIEFLDLRAPIATVKLTEPGVVTPGASGVSIAKIPAHPNGATVFLNWLLSRDGQALYSKTLNQPSFRADVPPPPGLPPEALAPAGEKPFMDTEETILTRPKLMNDAADILKAVMK